MATAHTEIIGDVSLPVGFYEDNGGLKKRSGRPIGVIMETSYPDGGRGLSVKLNADLFNPTLFALLARNTLKPGEHTVLCNVYRRDKPKASAASSGPAEEPSDNDGGPF